MGRAALVVSGGILLSRVLGFAREVALAGLLGRSIEADLYQHAFAIPDFLFFLMAGGYLTITFVPIISRHLAEGNPQEANRSFTAVLKVVGGAMLVVTAITFILARPIAEKVFAEVSADRMDDLVRLIRIILPAQFFFVIGSLLMAVQYAHRRFVIPTLAPLIYNVGIIAGGLISWGMGTPSPDGFVWGALVGAVLGNFGLQIWGARRLGLQVVPQTSLRHPAIPEYFALALPLMIGQSAVGLDEVFFRIFGQFAEVGNTAALGYARRINMVPIGVIAQAAGVASYPFLARLFAEGDLAGMRETVSRAVRVGTVVAGVGAAGTIALSLPLVQVAFQRGTFEAEDTIVTAALLSIYGISIPLWTIHQVYTRGFYAQRRMWLPVGVGTAITLLAIPAYAVSVDRLGVAGIAWTSVGVMGLYALALGWWWHRSAPAGAVGAALGRTVLSSVPAGLAGWWIVKAMMGSEPASFSTAALTLLVGAVVVIGASIGILVLVRSPELRLLRRQSGSPQ